MSFTDRLLLWLHVAFVVFTIGPVTIATMSTPRYIRARNVGVLRYLLRMTRIMVAGSLGVLLFGGLLAAQQHDFGKAWLVIAMTLFVVALVLLVMIMRDQHLALVKLEAAAEDEALTAANSTSPGTTPAGDGEATKDPAPAPAPPPAAAAPPGTDSLAHGANVERGRIASLAGIVGLIWLAILILMVWTP